MSCEIYSNNSLWGTITAAIFGLLILLSYLPQQVAIVVRQSTEGISPYFLLLMNLGSIFAFSNALVLSRPIFSCCVNSITAFDCFGSLCGTLQIMAGLLGPTVLLVLAVRFREPGEAGSEILRSAKIVAAVNFVCWLAVIIVTDPRYYRPMATGFGLASLAVGLVQYMPQLLTTYRLKHTGSLSILMMLIQIPGAYLWCLSLATRKGSHWSTWVGIFSAALLQTTLLFMALYYSSRKSAELASRMATPPPMAAGREAAPPLPDLSIDHTETTPLLVD